MKRTEFLVHIIFLSFMATFFGAPLLMLAIHWWATVFGMLTMRGIAS